MSNRATMVREILFYLEDHGQLVNYMVISTLTNNQVEATCCTRSQLVAWLASATDEQVKRARGHMREKLSVRET